MEVDATGMERHISCTTFADDEEEALQMMMLNVRNNKHIHKSNNLFIQPGGKQVPKNIPMKYRLKTQETYFENQAGIIDEVGDVYPVGTYHPINRGMHIWVINFMMPIAIYREKLDEVGKIKQYCKDNNIDIHISVLNDKKKRG